MDLNHDGSTSLLEVSYVADHGVAPVIIDGRECSEVFLLKDGLPIKVICDGD